MQVATSEITGRRGAVIVEDVFLSELAWVPRAVLQTDIGIDFHVEVVEDGHGTGRQLAVQVKSGPSFFETPAGDDGWWFPFGDKYHEYWLNYDSPVIVVLVDLESRTAYWQAVTADTVRSTGEGWKIKVLASQILGAGARSLLSALTEVAREDGDRALAGFSAALGMLPREAVSTLARLHAGIPHSDITARRPVERLASTLAEMRHDPDAACELMLEKTPEWLAQRKGDPLSWKGPTEHDVWLVVGGYANEHRLPARAAEAYRRAAAAGALPLGRWRAIAGLLEMAEDPARARETLASANALDGGRVLAEVGRALLDHQGIPGPVPVPPSLSRQAVKDWEECATALLFLGEQATRRQNLEEALDHYRAALALCPSSATCQLHVAQTLLNRLNTHASPGRDGDLREALRLAEAAREDRRRWAGPSAEAAEVLLQARILLPDVDAALSAALPAPEGEATDGEATGPRLAAFAARIAYRDGRIDLGDAFAARSTSTSPLHGPELAAARASAVEAPAEEQLHLWEATLKSAGTDEIRFVALQRLTELGQWPVPELEELLAAGVVRRDVHAVMAARAHQYQGDSAGAARFLRPYLRTSVHAILALADILQADGQPAQAARVLQDGAVRLADAHLELAALDMLRYAGDHQAAHTLSLRLLARPNVPQPIRLRLFHGLVRQAYLESEWSAAADHAQSGLDEIARARPDVEPSALLGIEPLAEDFVWCRAGALYNLRMWDEAWAVCQRFGAVANNRMAALIWLPLTSRQPWTPGGASAVLDLYDRFADIEEVAARALDTVDRALAVAHDPDSARFGAPWARSPDEVELTALRTRAAAATTDYSERHPDGSLTTLVGIPDAARLRALLGETASLDETHRQVCQAIRDGDAALGLAASSIRRPFLLSLIQRAAGLIPACSTDPAATEAEERAAAAALDGTVVIDLSALVVTGLLPERWDRLLAHFTAIEMPTVCMDDILMTESAVRRLQASSFTAGLGADASTVEITVLTDNARTQLATLVTTALRAAAGLALTSVPSLAAAEAALDGGQPAGRTPTDPDRALSVDVDGGWAAPLELAITSGLPLWCDDLFIREAARAAGVPTFGTRALTHVLAEQKREADTAQADDTALLTGYVVDLPPDKALWLAQSKADQWRPGPVTTALTRPAVWTSSDTLEIWASLAAEVSARQPDHLASWLYHASTGAAACSQDAAVLVAQVLTVAAIEAGPGATRALVEMSAEAARLQGMPAQAWRQAVTTELISAAEGGHLHDLSPSDIAQLTNGLVQGG
ncbi:hypothetical protein GCM10009665_74130 [Kitasatospora nipponensis]|uniref:DUF4365 domain-containing protein n=1 Tax=Kitasatospora nipponensis TaxID=258049 RepID=A0ABP4DQD8_9ACTN